MRYCRDRKRINTPARKNSPTRGYICAHAGGRVYIRNETARGGQKSRGRARRFEETSRRRWRSVVPGIGRKSELGLMGDDDDVFFYCGGIVGSVKWNFRLEVVGTWLNGALRIIAVGVEDGSGIFVSRGALWSDFY